MRKTKKTLLILTGLLSLSALASCGEQGPQGIPGKDGQDGLNGTDGKDGQDGIDGKDGADGSKILTGSGEPSSSSGATGDIYIDVETGDMYSKGESGWVKTGNIKGEKGDKGDAGTDGKDGSDGSNGTDGQNGKDGEDGVSITSVMKTSTDGNADTYTISYSDGSTSTFTVTNGVDGQPGAQGEKGVDGHTPTVTIGENGNWYVDGQDTGHKAQGPQGEKGDAGSDGVSIVAVVYTSSNGNFDTYTITYSDGSTTTFTVRNGIDGEDGRTPEITVDSDGCWCVDGVSTGVKARGEKGEKGDAGRGIASVTAGETSSDGCVEYTITYTDGSTSTFRVYNGKDGANGVTPFIGEDGYWHIGDANTGVKAQGEKGEKGDKGEDGRSVKSIGKTSSDGNVDTYTITYSDGTNSTFTITNGTDGSQGIQGEPGQDGHTPTIVIGDNGNWFIDGADSGISAKGEKGEKGDKGDTGVSVTKAYIDDNGDLICEMSDGTTINAGHVKDVTKHTVNFHVDDEIIQTLSVEDGAKISAPGEDATSGYTIKSWSSKEDDGFLWRFSVYTVTSDLDLYADFDYNTYTVTYVDETYGTAIDPLTVTYDQAYELTKINGIEGYTHTVWKDSSGASYDFSGKWRKPGDVTVYASWSANTYTVTLDPNKGRVAKAKVTVTYDSQYELPTPTRENYVFLGWYDSSDKKVSSKATWKGTENATYTAKWTNVQNTYNFDAGDGTCDVETMTIGWEDAYTLPTPTAPTYDGEDGECAFDGWFLGETIIAQSGDSWTYSNQGGTLVAHYTCKKDIAGSTPAVDAENGTVTYGIYPQTRISDETMIKCLNVWTAESNGWYLLDGSYYAKKSASPYKSSYVFDDGATIVWGTTYWFKCEPITWKILSSDNGEYSLVSTVLLDAHRYNGDYSGTKNGRYANNYAWSEIREWLYNEFYYSAFSLGNSLIQTTTVDNSASTTSSSSNKYACANTYGEVVYLLSYKDYLNADYGFSTDEDAHDTARRCKTTDWARANGAWYSTSSSYLYNGYYWTRSPGSSYSYDAWRVNGDGGLCSDGVSDSDLSVRPSLRIKVAQ